MYVVTMAIHKHRRLRGCNLRRPWSNHEHICVQAIIVLYGNSYGEQPLKGYFSAQVTALVQDCDATDVRLLPFLLTGSDGSLMGRFVVSLEVTYPWPYWPWLCYSSVFYSSPSLSLSHSNLQRYVTMLTVISISI